MAASITDKIHALNAKVEKLKAQRIAQLESSISSMQAEIADLQGIDTPTKVSAPSKGSATPVATKVKPKPVAATGLTTEKRDGIIEKVKQELATGKWISSNDLGKAVNYPKLAGILIGIPGFENRGKGRRKEYRMKK